MALLAGCAGRTESPLEPSTTDDPDPESPGAAPQVESFSISALVSFGNRSGPVPYSGSLGSVDGADARTGGTVQVGDNATVLIAESRLDCAVPCAVWLGAFDSGGERRADSGPVNGGDIRVVYSPPNGVASGEWFIRLYTEGASMNVNGDLRVSVFYDGSVPDGYTAF